MPSEIEISRISALDWLTYKETRIEALRDSPSAFGSTLNQALKQSDENWKARIGDASSTMDLPLFAKIQGKAIGLAWGKIHAEEVSSAHLFQMWVAPSSRGKGAGIGLLNTVIDWAREQRVSRLLLSVTIDDSAAWQMYRSSGFKETGAAEPLREGSSVMTQPMALVFENDA